MKYIKALEDLHDTLESFLNIYEVGQKRESLILELKENIDIRKLFDIFNKDLPIGMLNKKDLYYLLKGFKNFHDKNEDIIKFNNNLLEPTNYFTDIEIDDIKHTLVIPENTNNELFLFENVIKLDEKQYIVGKITSKQLLDLIYNNFVKYDFSMQRESEKVSRNGITYERVKIYSKSIKGIKESMKSNRYRPTAISINILDRSDDEDIEDESLVDTHFFYDEKDKTFLLSSKDRVSLIDGMHRLYAIMECANEDPNFEQLMQLNILFLTQKEARDYIYQEGQKNPIDKAHLNRFNSTNIYMNIVSELEKMGNKNDNLIQGLIGTDKNDVVLLNKFTTFTKFSEALKENITLKDNDFRERRRLKSFLNLFFNDLISLNDVEFNNIGKIEDRLYTNPNLIYAYIRVAMILRNKFKNNLDDKLLDILDSEEFTQEIKYIIKEIGNKFDITKKSRDEIYNRIDLVISKILGSDSCES